MLLGSSVCPRPTAPSAWPLQGCQPRECLLHLSRHSKPASSSRSGRSLADWSTPCCQKALLAAEQTQSSVPQRGCGQPGARWASGPAGVGVFVFFCFFGERAARRLLTDVLDQVPPRVGRHGVGGRRHLGGGGGALLSGGLPVGRGAASGGALGGKGGAGGGRRPLRAPRRALAPRLPPLAHLPESSWSRAQAALSAAASSSMAGGGRRLPSGSGSGSSGGAGLGEPGRLPR